MAFPETPLPISVEISTDGSTWTDITSDVRAADKIQITRGRSDWGQTTDPARCSFSLNNTDGTYSPRNPESPYYGQIGRNTPVRVSVKTGDTALWLPGDSSNDTISTPDTADLDITGDIDVRIDATLVNWHLADGALGAGTTSFLTELIGKFDVNGDQRSWTMYIRNGFPRFSWSEDGGFDNGYVAVCTEKLPVPPHGRIALRAALDVDNGSGGFTCRFYISDTIDGVWVQIGEDAVGVATTNIYAGTGDLHIGNAVNGTNYNMPIGYVHAAEVRDGIDGDIVANPVFSNVADGSTTFTDEAGLTWTCDSDGNAEVTNRKIRFVGEISSWTPQWDTGGFDVVTHVEAAGILRRLSQGVIPAKSPMYREFTSPFRDSIVAYWPMEDGTDATNIASAFDSHPPMKITGTVTPGAYSDWTASDPVLTIGTGSLRVNVPSYTATNYIFMRVFVAVPEAGVPSNQRLFSFSQTGTARIWSLWVNTSGSLGLVAFDNEDQVLLNTGYWLFDIFGKKKSIGIELTQSGGNINYRLTSYDIDASTLTTPSNTAITGTVSTATIGRVTQFRFGEDGLLNDTAFGHLALSNSSDGFASVNGPLLGWNGEMAASRVHRLGVEENIHAYSTLVGDEQMGVQPRGTIIELMRGAEDVDQGILGEQRDVLGIKLVQRTSLYNQAPSLVMNYEGSDGLVAPLDPVDDDQSVTNDVTVTRDGGSFTRTTLNTGPLSTQKPPDGVGLYDTSYSFNLYSDEQTPHHAGWLLHRGTWDETRYPQVTVDLANAPESIDDAVRVDFGCRIQITNPPVWLPPDTIDLLVLGYTESFDQFSWQITYNCAPFGPYNVAYEGVSPQSLYTHVDTSDSMLAEDLTISETEVDVTSLDETEWVMAAPSVNTNYDFETDLTGWTGNGCTIERVPTPGIPPFLGQWSMKITPDGVSEYPNAGTDLVPVTPGTSYTYSGWQMCETSRSCDLNINWFDSDFNYLSTDANAEAMTAGEWVWFQATATAPVGAAYVNIAPTVPTFPPATDVLYTDMVTLRPTIEGELPDDFPFDVRVGGEVMRVTACNRSVYDTFARTVASGWGTADSGQTWTVVGTAANYAVGSGYGSTTFPSTGIAHIALAPAPAPDIDMYVDIATDALATGNSLFGGPLIRATDNNNHYMCRLEFTAANAIGLTIRKRVTGTETVLGALTTRLTHVAGTFYRVRFQVIGDSLRAKAWLTTLPEPGNWMVTATDTSITSTANIGFRGFSNTGNTNTNPQVRYANFKVINPQTFTVTRSMNGVSKAHEAGTDVRLAYPAITAL